MSPDSSSLGRDRLEIVVDECHVHCDADLDAEAVKVDTGIVHGGLGVPKMVVVRQLYQMRYRRGELEAGSWNRQIK
jgi:hypothetical protein